MGEARAQLDREQQRNRRRRRSQGVEDLIKRRVGHSAGQSARGLTIIRRLFERFFPPPDAESDRQFPARTITLTVLLIPIILVAIVVVTWASDIGETDFEQCLSELIETVNLAQSINSSDRQGVMAAWSASLLLVDECENLRPGDETVATMRSTAQNVMDALNNIKRRVATPLASFENASITRMRLQGLDLYALDATNDLVYRVKINGEGNGIISQEPIPSMRRGATIDGLTLGALIDIAFDDVTGEVALLDENGILVRCSPQFIMDCNAQRILAVEQWQNPIALNIWSGRLYVLDSEGGQIWRYDPSGGTYASAPREYFAGESRPNLRKVIDFTISLAGTVYIMYDDGVMKTYVGGEEKPFAFSGFNEGRELSAVTAQGFFLNDSPIDPAFFVISRPARTIFETTLAGTYIDSYQVFEQDKLALLSNIVAYPTQNIVYVASGNSIFSINKGD
jgi:hypothetical protein